MSESIAATARLDRQKLSEQAREAIRDRIVQGAFPLGRKLPEAELVELLSMSKSPIREALLQLEREGLIEMAAGRSARVFSMGAAEIAELGELRQMLELQAMRMALERNPGPLRAALDGIAARMEDALSRGDTGAYKLLDHDFHDAIFDNCGNSFVRDNFRRLSFRVQALRNRLSLDDALNQKSLGEHIAIADAVAAGRGEAAVALLSTHIGDTIEAYLARLAAEAEAEPASEALTPVRIALEEMERFSRAALAAVGADDPTIKAVTKALLHASALGVDTHGFRLLPHYLQGLSEGRLNRTPKLEIVQETGGACVLEADDAHGARAGYAAVERALELARTHGLAAVAIRGSSHFGAAGAYALEIARHGMMGLAFCNSDSFVRLHGGAVRFHGTNPIAAAAPAGEGEPWLLDMATSAIPFNRVQLNRSLGAALPEDVASDARGVNVTDPAIVEMLAPLGGALFGYKGAGLAGLAEIFSTAFSDAPLSFELPPMISDDMATPRRLGAFVMALDPEAFGGRAVFEAVIRRYLAAIAASPAAPGETVMAPGTREWAEAERRRAQGMKLDRGSVEALARFAETHGIEPLRYRSGGR